MSLIAGAVVIGIRGRGWLESLELTAYDASLAFQPASTAFVPPLTLITVTEADIQRVGRWPLTDAVLAETLRRLLKHGPRVVGFDIYRDLEVPPGREMLNALLRTNRNVIGIMKFGPLTTGGIAPPSVLMGSEQVGFSDMVVDSDGLVRRGLFFLDDGREVSPSFALVLALRYLEAEGIGLAPDPRVPTFLRIGRTTFPPLEPDDGAYVDADMRGYQFLLNNPRKDLPYPAYPLAAVLADAVPASAVRDRVVIIGVKAEGVKDYFWTAGYRDGWQVQRVAGMELHASMVSQLIHAALMGNPTLRFWSDGEEQGWILGWAILGGVSGVVISGLWAFALVILAGVMVVGILAYWAVVIGWWIPSVPAMLAWAGALSLMTAYRAKKEKKERQLVEYLFSPYVAHEVLHAIWMHRDRVLEGGRLRPQKLVVTVLFCDLEGFTSIAETMAPQRLMEWLNSYMDMMTRVIMDHGGVVDDYYGDAIKANFGVPFPRGDETAIRRDAVNAVRCAVAMEQAMTRIVQERQEDLPSVRLRIGICTGLVMGGSLGSPRRLKYTTVGDTVNIAARLESLQKESQASFSEDRTCRILIAESTRLYVEGLWALQHVGALQVKGKRNPVRAYRVLLSPISSAE